MLTSFSNDKMYAVTDLVAWLHFAVFFALKKKVSIYIDFLSAGANDSRCNNGEAEIPVDH
jgi:hypothetical protein